MLDIHFIKENADRVQKAARNKRVDVSITRLLATYEKRNKLQQELDALRSEANEINRNIQSAIAAEKKTLLAKAKKIKGKSQTLEKKFKETDKEYLTLLLKVPNVPTEDTPIGKDDSENKVIKTVGKKTSFSFIPKPHWELGEALDIFDQEKAAAIAGARFNYIKNELVLVQFALINFVLSVVTSESKLKKIFKKADLGSLSTKPFVPVLPPVFVRSAVFSQMDRLEPREDKYELPEDDQFLIGSAEHTLGPLHMNETIPEEELPIRYIGYSTCFRREAGTYGKDTKGLIRQHQFDKLEMETFTTPENGIVEQEGLVAIQEHIMSELQLPYQKVAICTGDMGKPDARQIDLETWMPEQNKYRETHSADYMADFQSRRLKISVKRKEGKQLVYMNDATAVAFGRTLATIIENYQTKKGGISIPKVLRPYMHGIKEISRD